MKTLAESYFEAELARWRLADKIETALETSLAAWSDWTADHYDESIEVYGVLDPDEETAAVALLKTQGFKIVWLHDHEKSERWVDGKLCRCKAR